MGTDRSVVWWFVAGNLLGFLFLTHFLVVVSFVLGWRISPAIAPAALLLSLSAGDWLARREGLRLPYRAIATATAAAVVVVSLLTAGAFYDMSWDGLWYHQTAVYHMSRGWNPVSDPMRSFTPHLQDWVRHYAKGPWYIASSLYATTGSIEMAKAAPWIALAATFFAVVSAAIHSGVRRSHAFLLAALVSMNPVTVFELASFLVDGLMISFLACFVAALFRWFRRPSLTVLWVMATSAVLCVNSKFTGLAYLCAAIASGGVYLLMNRRELLVRYAAIQSAVLLSGVLLFGFNPYVTNTAHRGHPFYPILGTASYPSHGEQGEDPIERYETPHNLMGRDRLVRLAYAVFGRPGAPPFFPRSDAELMMPFDVGWKDFKMYYFHDVRISGFGPLFSGALLVSVALTCLAMVRPGIPRDVVLLLTGAIVLSLLISPHTWWARYGPQLWWVPVWSVAAGLAVGSSRGIRFLAFTLASVLLLNSAAIGVVHFKWESEATRATNEQLRALRGESGIVVDLQYFGEPFSERLKNAGVEFTPVQTLPCAEPIELMSVSPGYPNAVRACLQSRITGHREPTSRQRQ